MKEFIGLCRTLKDFKGLYRTLQDVISGAKFTTYQKCLSSDWVPLGLMVALSIEL